MSARRFRVEVKRPSGAVIAEVVDLIVALTGIDGGVRVKPGVDPADVVLAHLGGKLARAEWALLVNSSTEVASLVSVSAIHRIEVVR